MVRTAPYAAPALEGLFVDVMTANQGYVTAGCIGSGAGYERLKFQVRKGGQTYNYDLDPTASPTRYPINMGDGDYLFRIMERVDGNNYAQVSSVGRSVELVSRFVPYTISTVFCDYDVHGPCVRMSRYIAVNCKTDLSVLNAVTKWVAGYLSYDYAKASRLSGGTGYVPNPDETLRHRSGICFDYASMEAAMLRSLCIPCRVITGYLDSSLYHAWVSAFANGRWRRRDPTIVSVSAKRKEPTGKHTYENRFIY